MPLVMTFILVASSLTIHYAEHLLHLGNKAGFRTWYLLTIVLGACFLGMSVYEWSHLIHGLGFTISTNAFSTIFFSVTGLHGSHVVVGLAIFLAGLPSVMRGTMSMRASCAPPACTGTLWTSFGSSSFRRFITGSRRWAARPARPVRSPRRRRTAFPTDR
jgi:heme/copper-type cytochrome/quinol oxidase subunit 3